MKALMITMSPECIYKYLTYDLYGGILDYTIS